MPAAVKAGSRPPWVGLAAAVWVQVAAGSGYNFPLYSPSLKSVMGYTQQQLTMLGVANDIGENFGMIAGVACNRFPPWLVLLIGAASCFLGFGVLWLAVTQTVSGLSYWVGCLSTISGSFEFCHSSLMACDCHSRDATCGHVRPSIFSMDIRVL